MSFNCVLAVPKKKSHIVNENVLPLGEVEISDGGVTQAKAILLYGKKTVHDT